jgi:hypothetical protein
VSRFVVAAALLLTLTGCGGSGSVSSQSTGASETTGLTTAETKNTIVSSKALGCLEQAGLSGVEERAGDTWRGFHDGPSYAIVVHKLATPAKAPTVVAGMYAVTGQFKVSAEGEGLTNQEGLEADALVQEVADCLGA